MKKENQKQKKVTNLHKKAEKKLKPETIDIEKLSETEVRKLTHELQVHQIELEMQNEELRRSQQELENSRDRYSRLYDFAPVGYLTISEKGFILEANLTYALMLGVERSPVDKEDHYQRSLPGEDQDKYYLSSQSYY